jgi:uncharacterized protein YacL
MVLTALRALFVLLMAAAGWYVLSTTVALRDYTWLTLAITLTLGTVIICVDILAPRKKLQLFAGTFLGLFVGLLVTYALSFVVKLLLAQYVEMMPRTLHPPDVAKLEFFLNLVIGMVCCYLCISFVLQTRDDFRFIVPYVEFKRQTKGHHPILLDTSALVDGRIADVAATGILQHQLVVPRFVLDELHALSDSADKLKRGRGRRGLDVLKRLQDHKLLDLYIYDSSLHHEEGVHEGADQKLMELAGQLEARILTTDFNLNKVAQLQGVQVINVNDLASALRPVVLPGERMVVRIVKAGEESGQGVGYLDDGTMVVVEQGREHMNQEVEFLVTKLHQTSAGRMIFGRADGSPAAGAATGTRRGPQPAPASKAPGSRTDSTSSPA